MLHLHIRQQFSSGLATLILYLRCHSLTWYICLTTASSPTVFMFNHHWWFILPSPSITECRGRKRKVRRVIFQGIASVFHLLGKVGIPYIPPARWAGALA